MGACRLTPAASIATAVARAPKRAAIRRASAERPRATAARIAPAAAACADVVHAFFETAVIARAASLTLRRAIRIGARYIANAAIAEARAALGARHAQVAIGVARAGAARALAIEAWPAVTALGIFGARLAAAEAGACALLAIGFVAFHHAMLRAAIRVVLALGAEVRALTARRRGRAR